MLADLTEVWQLKVQGLLHTHVLCGYRVCGFSVTALLMSLTSA